MLLIACGFIVVTGSYLGTWGEARPFYLPAWYPRRALPEWKTISPHNTFARGEGMTVVLEDGTRFEDWEGQSLVNNIGLGRAEMARVIAEQALRLSWLAPSLFADVRVALARDLQSVLPPGISVPFYGIGGADSIEVAIRAARKVTRRKNILAFTGGFHGDTITTESVSGWGVLEYGDPRPWCVHVPSPHIWFQELGDWDRAYERCLEGVDKALKKHKPRSFACLLVEPVTGVGGGVPLSEGLSKALRELCDQHGIKLIADEVVTGFGRTGEWFGSTAVGLKPDAIVLAKGMTGGYVPLGAVVFEASWGEELRADEWRHGPTFGGHPVACAAARETIRILREERLVERAKSVGAHMRKRLQELWQKHPAVVRDVRGKGLLLGMELRPASGETPTKRSELLAQEANNVRAYMERRLGDFVREPRGTVRQVTSTAFLLARDLSAARRGRKYSSHPASGRVWAIFQALENEGMRAWTSGDGSSLMFCPPFIVTEAQVDRLVDRLDFHLREIALGNTGSTSTQSLKAA